MVEKKKESEEKEEEEREKEEERKDEERRREGKRLRFFFTLRHRRRRNRSRNNPIAPVRAADSLPCSLSFSFQGRRKDTIAYPLSRQQKKKALEGENKTHSSAAPRPARRRAAAPGEERQQQPERQQPARRGPRPCRHPLRRLLRSRAAESLRPECIFVGREREKERGNKGSACVSVEFFSLSLPNQSNERRAMRLEKKRIFYPS